MKKSTIILLIIAIAIAACVGISIANRPITDERDLEFEYERTDLSLTYITAYPLGGRRWITAESDKIFVVVCFNVTNRHKKKSQKITKPFVLKVAESDLTFEDRCPWAERSLAEREIKAGETIFDDVCFEIPKELAESEFLIEHNGQQWQIPPSY